MRLRSIGLGVWDLGLQNLGSRLQGQNSARTGTLLGGNLKSANVEIED